MIIFNLYIKILKLISCIVLASLVSNVTVHENITTTDTLRPTSTYNRNSKNVRASLQSQPNLESGSESVTQALDAMLAKAPARFFKMTSLRYFLIEHYGVVDGMRIYRRLNRLKMGLWRLTKHVPKKFFGDFTDRYPHLSKEQRLLLMALLLDKFGSRASSIKTMLDNIHALQSEVIRNKYSLIHTTILDIGPSHYEYYPLIRSILGIVYLAETVEEFNHMVDFLKSLAVREGSIWHGVQFIKVAVEAEHIIISREKLHKLFPYLANYIELSSLTIDGISRDRMICVLTTLAAAVANKDKIIIKESGNLQLGKGYALINIKPSKNTIDLAKTKELKNLLSDSERRLEQEQTVFDRDSLLLLELLYLTPHLSECFSALESYPKLPPQEMIEAIAKLTDNNLEREILADAYGLPDPERFKHGPVGEYPSCSIGYRQLESVDTAVKSSA